MESIEISYYNLGLDWSCFWPSHLRCLFLVGGRTHLTMLEVAKTSRSHVVLVVPQFWVSVLISLDVFNELISLDVLNDGLAFLITP